MSFPRRLGRDLQWGTGTTAKVAGCYQVIGEIVDGFSLWMGAPCLCEASQCQRVAVVVSDEIDGGRFCLRCANLGGTRSTFRPKKPGFFSGWLGFGFFAVASIAFNGAVLVAAYELGGF